jgi:biotin carboxyl carrier protein
MTQTEKPEKKTRLKSLVIEGTKYKTNFTEKYENRKFWEEPDKKKIVSYIPGTIIKIYVKEGQKIKAGTMLLILEAMKMKNKILSPMDGKVKSIFVKEGNLVSKDALMVELE